MGFNSGFKGLTQISVGYRHLVLYEIDQKVIIIIIIIIIIYIC